MSHGAMLRSLSILGLAIAVAVPAVSQAQDAAPVRVRGTIERVEGDTFIVKSRDGAELKVGLSDKALIVAIVKASLSDIKSNSFVGVTGMPNPMAVSALLKCTFSLNQCAGLAKDITRGIFGHKAP